MDANCRATQLNIFFRVNFQSELIKLNIPKIKSVNLTAYRLTRSSIASLKFSQIFSLFLFPFFFLFSPLFLAEPVRSGSTRFGPPVRSGPVRPVQSDSVQRFRPVQHHFLISASSGRFSGRFHCRSVRHRMGSLDRASAGVKSAPSPANRGSLPRGFSLRFRRFLTTWPRVDATGGFA